MKKKEDAPHGDLPKKSILNPKGDGKHKLGANGENVVPRGSDHSAVHRWAKEVRGLPEGGPGRKIARPAISGKRFGNSVAEKKWGKWAEKDDATRISKWRYGKTTALLQPTLIL